MSHPYPVKGRRRILTPPLKVGILCRYCMGLNLANEQIANELDVDRSDVQQMTTQLR